MDLIIYKSNAKAEIFKDYSPPANQRVGYISYIYNHPYCESHFFFIPLQRDFNYILYPVHEK